MFRRNKMRIRRKSEKNCKIVGGIGREQGGIRKR
jgi:hypothetical protein